MKRNCIQCAYYYVTWDVNAPRGCRMFGFKSQTMPSKIVEQHSGLPCPYFKQGKRKPSSIDDSNKKS